MVSLATFILMLGLFWTINPVSKPAPDSDDDPEEAEKKYRTALQRQARLGLFRGGLILAGLGLCVLAFLMGLGRVEAGERLAFFTVIYGILALAVQRSEANRRLATLILFVSPFWLIILPRYAVYRGEGAESNWAFFAALGLNYLFWLTLGKWFPVGSSEEIVVWGMDTK